MGRREVEPEGEWFEVGKVEVEGSRPGVMSDALGEERGARSGRRTSRISCSTFALSKTRKSNQNDG
jgi:hypothetical protein